MLHFDILDPRVTPDHLGLIPSFLSNDDPRDAVAQIDANYQHGGGWRDSKVGDGGWKPTAFFGMLKWPKDPPILALAKAVLHPDRKFIDAVTGEAPTTRHPPEMVIIYESAWVAVIQAGGVFRVARID